MGVGYAHTTSSIVAALKRNDDRHRQQFSIDDALAEHPVLDEDSALIGISGEFVREIKETLPLEPASLLASFLTAAGAALDAHALVHLRGIDYPLRLFTVVADGTGARSELAIMYARQILDAAQTALSSRTAPRVAVAKGSLRTAEDFSEVLSGNGIISSPAQAPQAVPGCIPVLMQVDNFAATWRALNRQSSALADMLRASIDETDVALAAGKGGRVPVRARVSLLGRCFLDQIQSLTPQNSYLAELASCFLWVEGKRADRMTLPRAIEKKLQQKLGRELASAIRFAERTGQVTPTAESEQQLERFSMRFAEFQPGRLALATSRADLHVLRLAGIYALLDRSAQILPMHMEAAIAFWRYCEATARVLFTDQESDAASLRIRQALSEEPKTTTQLHGLFQRHIKLEQLNRVLNDLASRGLIGARRVHIKSERSRPALVWELTRRQSGAEPGTAGTRV